MGGGRACERQEGVRVLDVGRDLPAAEEFITKTDVCGGVEWGGLKQGME